MLWSPIVGFFRFWYDFIVGDDWIAAVGVALALTATGLLAQSGTNAWWLMAAAVPLVLGITLLRAASRRA
jgi:hypothetical protein